MLITEHRFELTLLALREILKFQHPADAVLSQFFRREHPGAQERNLIAETVFGILRHKLLLDHACTFQQLSTSKATARRLALAYWIRFGGYNLRELQPLLRAGEDKWLCAVKGMTLDNLPLTLQADLPQWVVDKLRAQMDDDAIRALGLALQQAAPLDLRINPLKTNREELQQALAAEGIHSTPTLWSPLGLRVTGKPHLSKSALFLSGRFEVQDEGSQLLALLLAPKRNDMVVDFCAGAGGKTLLLGALMHSQGRLYAWDVSEKRLANLKPRLARSGLSNVQPQRISDENEQKVKRLAGKIDRVLVDAPCSGLGTLRRNPDLKFRQSPESVAELGRKQAAILRSAARLVRPGGRLVYATCSFLQEENQAIVTAFLSEYPDFQLLPAGEVLAQQKIALAMGDFLQLDPQRHGTDCFFAAVLERRP